MARADSAARGDRLLPWIAAERTCRAVVILAAGVVLLSRPHADWASEVSNAARSLGLDPNSNWIRKLIEKVRHVSAHEQALFGALALAYGALEGAEAYGLWRRRRWGEWLTVVATSMFLVPEAWELSKSVTALKLGGLLINLAVVVYLIARLKRSSPVAAHGPARPR